MRSAWIHTLHRVSIQTAGLLESFEREILPVELVESSSKHASLHEDNRDGGYEPAGQFEAASPKSFVDKSHNQQFTIFLI